MDRTNELQSFLASAGVPTKHEKLDKQQEFADRPDANVAGSSVDKDFHSLVEDFGMNLRDGQSRLTVLSKLSKEKGIYNDRTSQINTATLAMKKAIDALEQKMVYLDGVYTANERSLSRQAKEHRQNIMANLRSRMLDMTKEFKEVVDHRAESIKRQEDRKSLYASTENSQAWDIEAAPWEPGTQAQLQVAPLRTGYQRSRAEAAETIRSMVVDLGQMFHRVAALVHEQEEMVMRIDQDVDNTLANVSEGEKYLMKYFKRITSSRRLILKVFGMLFTFALFFILFLA